MRRQWWRFGRSLIKPATDFDLVFSDKLAQKLCEDLVLMKDVYDFLVLCEQKARGVIKYD